MLPPEPGSRHHWPYLVFLLTNRCPKQDRQITTQAPQAANHTNLMIHYAMKAVDMLYRCGYNSYKVGVIVGAGQVQGVL